MALVRHPTPSRWRCGSGSSTSMLSNQWPRIAAWDALVDPQNSIAICHRHKTLPRVLVTVRDKPGLCCGHVRDLNFLSHKHSAVHAVRTVFRHTLFGVSAIGARLQHDWRPYGQVMLPAPRQWQAPLEMFFLWAAKESNQQRLGLLRVSVFDLYKLLSCCGSLFVLSLTLAVVFAGLSLFHKNGKCNFSN